MKPSLLGLLLGLAFAASVLAGPRKVLVLPLDGNADAATRKQLNATIVKLARGIDGHVTTGDTTFAETAAAVGCDPAQPSCADNVLATLSVDELVWGTATTANGQTSVVVKRVTKGSVPQTQTIVISAGDPPGRAESDLQPVFGGHAGSGSAGSGDLGSGGPGSGSETGSAGSAGSGASGGGRRGSFFDTRERKLGVGLVAGGGLALIIGFSLWASEDGVQGKIDTHPTNTLAEIQDLKSLEDKAGSYALWGNVMVVVGLAAGGVGAYYLWKDHKNRMTATVAPPPAEAGQGMTLVIGGRW